MMPMPLQLDCSGDLIDKWAGLKVWDGIFCPYATPADFGMVGIGAVFAFVGATVLWSWSETVALPAAWLALLSGVILASVPGAMATRIVGIVTVAVTIAFVALWRAWR